MNKDALPRVLLTRRLPERAMEVLSSRCLLDLWPEDRPMPRNELLAGMEQVDGLI